MGGIVLVQHTLAHALIDHLHGGLVSALGLGALAFRGSSLKLLDRGLQRAAIGLVAGVAGLSPTLDKVLELQPAKLELIMDEMKKILTPMAQNGAVIKYSLVHKIFLDFFLPMHPQTFDQN